MGPKSNAFVCPFCQGSGKSSNEHVWAKWLHKAPVAKTLMAGYSGERRPNVRSKTILGKDGTFALEPEHLGHWSTLLPQVKVAVCQSCNNGWMSALETRAYALLEPLIFRGETVHLTEDDCVAVAAWAAKTFLGYGLTQGSQGNPFSPSDYEHVRVTQTAPPGMRVWILTADSRWAHVGLELKSWTLFAKDTSPPVIGPVNSSLCFLAAGGVVFLATKLPITAAALGDALIPPGSEPWPRELTGNTSGIDLTPDALDEVYMDEVHQWWFIPEQFGLPSPEGLTPGDVTDIHQSFVAGVAPYRLRQLVGKPQAPRPQAAIDHQHTAEQEAESIARQDPRGAALYLSRTGREHFYHGDPAGAAALMEEAFALPGGGFENDPKAAYRVAQAYYQLQDLRAAEWYRRTLKLGWQDNRARFGLIDSLKYAGRYAEALKELRAVVPTGGDESATVYMATVALDYVVNHLKIPTQDREPVRPDEVGGLPRDTLRALLLNRDATSPLVWVALGWAEPSIEYHGARAWFGDAGDSWMLVALHRSHTQTADQLEPLLRLGLSRSPHLALERNDILDVLATSGAPVERLRTALDAATAT